MPTLPANWPAAVPTKKIKGIALGVLAAFVVLPITPIVVALVLASRKRRSRK